MPSIQIQKIQIKCPKLSLFASNGFSQYSFQNQLLKSILDSYLRVKKGFEKGKCYIWYICVNEKGSLSAIRHWDDKDKDPTNTIVFEKLCLRRHLYFFRIPPPPHPHVGGDWEYMRIFFLPNCSALVWNYKFGLRETFWPSLNQRRILNAKIAQGDAADGQFLPFQIAQLVWNYKFGLGEKHSTHHSPPLFHSAAQLGILIACQSSTATFPSSSS